MTIQDYLNQKNEEYKAAKVKENDLVISRSILLDLPQDLQYTDAEFKALIAACLPCKGLSTETSINNLAEAAHDYLLLSIDFSLGKPRVKEDFTAWLNIDTYELTAAKPFSFSSCIPCAFVQDYRKAGAGITWLDLVRRTEAA